MSGIPEIIHQTWKINKIPLQWRWCCKKVKKVYSDWEYRLWTDDDNLNFVKDYFPEYLDVYNNLPKNIMRADMIRYFIMYRIGGMYLDFDYEVFRKYDFSGVKVLLPKNRSISYGDSQDELGNCIFASVPGHKFWKDVLDTIADKAAGYTESTNAVIATGPNLLTEVFRNGSYKDITLPERSEFHPVKPKNYSNRKALRRDSNVFGIHWGWGTWKKKFKHPFLLFLLDVKGIIISYLYKY